MRRYDENKKKWEKQSWDKKNPYNYFSFFLDYCARNKWKTAEAKVKTCEYFSRNKNYIERISAEFEWLYRSESYKAYLEEEQRKEFEAEYKKRCKETFLQIGATSQIIGQKLNSIMAELKSANGDSERIKDVIGNLSLPQIVQVLKLNQDTMKMILGIPDKQDVSVNGNVAATVKDDTADLKAKLDKLTLEERDMYFELCDKINSAGESE